MRAGHNTKLINGEEFPLTEEDRAPHLELVQPEVLERTPVDQELLAEGQRIVEAGYGDFDSMGGETVPPRPSEAYLRALGQLQVRDAYGGMTEMGGN